MASAPVTARNEQVDQDQLQENPVIQGPPVNITTFDKDGVTFKYKEKLEGVPATRDSRGKNPKNYAFYLTEDGKVIRLFLSNGKLKYEVVNLS